MGRKERQQAAPGDAVELATDLGKNTLVFFLVSRFIAVLAAVVLALSAIVWLESITFLPILQTLLPDTADRSFETTSFVSLMGNAWMLLQSILGPDGLPRTAFLARSAAVLAVIAMLILLAAPVFAGALVFASMVGRKVRALQEQRERELVQIARQRSQFIADIAHDLRTPLMAISGMSHALADGIVPSEAQKDEYVRSICEQSDKMGALVNSVLDYSKLGSGSFALDRRIIDLTQLLLSESALAYADAEDAGMVLTTLIPEERCAIYADSVQISRVVANLIANAIRHNGPGTEVSVLLVRRPAIAFAIVADTGAPIPGNPEDLFQPFAQGDSSRPGSRAGSGLGLSICKGVADMHGYAFSVSQPYGRFTKAFVLQCPVVD